MGRIRLKQLLLNDFITLDKQGSLARELDRRAGISLDDTADGDVDEGLFRRMEFDLKCN